MAFLPPGKKQVSVTLRENTVETLKDWNPRDQAAPEAREIVETVVRDGYYATLDKQLEDLRAATETAMTLERATSNSERCLDLLDEMVKTTKDALWMVDWHTNNARDLYGVIIWLSTYLTGKEPVDNLDRTVLDGVVAMAVSNYELFSRKIKT